MDKSILKVKNIEKSFKKLKVLKGISFEVKKNLITGFIGPNGAGKTTTIKIIMNLLFPEKGEIFFKNKKINLYSYKYKYLIGYLPEDNNTFYTGKLKNLYKITLDYYKTYKSFDDSELNSIFEKFSINLNLKFKNLSMGNKRKALFINEIIKKPEFLILDEPTNGLDIVNRELFYDIISELNYNGTTIFLSSHNLSDIENLCNELIVINKGNIIFTGNIEKLKINLFLILILIYKKFKNIEKFKNSIEKDLLNIENLSLYKFLEKRIEKLKKIDKIILNKIDKFFIKYDVALKNELQFDIISLSDFQFIFEYIFKV